MSKNAPFQKFINQKSNAARKEAFKQEKKAAKKEKAAAIEKRFEEKRRIKALQSNRPHAQPVSAAAKMVDKNNVFPTSPVGVMPLNKFIAHSGICSRRDAAELIKKGEVKVNEETVTEPGTKVSEKDIIKVKGRIARPSRNFVYILLNKPKDYITTSEDPQGRKTVLDLIRHATPERVYPVGRLDRNTSGVLLLTNDGDMAQTLSHPKHQIKKVYEVRLDRPLTKADFEKLLKGIQLEDGLITPDAMGYVEPNDHSVIGIEIHSGRNRIVRRMFEHLRYDVRGLDRVMYAGLTKKNVQRGKWRLLTEKEIRILRHFNPQTKKEKTGKIVAKTKKPGI